MVTETQGERVARTGIPGFGGTQRVDRWWAEPLATAVALALFVAYSTWAVLAGTDYAYGPYISPFYSPLVRSVPISPAIFVAWIPLLFRLSCYYYRKAYYRAFFLSPPACAVSEPSRDYSGEDRPPLSWLPVMHRWFLYLSILVVLWLWADALRAFDWNGYFGVGLGSLIMLGNVVLLTGFTFGCHALRSAVGGNLRCFSCSAFGATRYRLWRGVSFLNAFHGRWAWLSLLSVAFTDLYIRMCAAGALADLRFY